MNNIRGPNGNLNQDLNHSGIVDMKIRRLNSATRFKVTSMSMNRMNSNRSMKSQKSLEALEKGWSSKFKKAKALDLKTIQPLSRPTSATKN